MYLILCRKSLCWGQLHTGDICLHLSLLSSTQMHSLSVILAHSSTKTKKSANPEGSMAARRFFHRFSFGVRSGNWLGHSWTIFFFCKFLSLDAWDHLEEFLLGF